MLNKFALKRKMEHIIISLYDIEDKVKKAELYKTAIDIEKAIQTMKKELKEIREDIIERRTNKKGLVDKLYNIVPKFEIKNLQGEKNGVYSIGGKE